jgi:two-component system sensor histidine kinase ChiS
VAQTATRTLSDLVDDLLDLARMESGRLDLAIRPVDVGEAIERVQRLVAAQAATKEITLEIRVAADLPPVAADLDRLVQVLFNLLGNAIKFTDHGSVRVHATVGDRECRITVEDTGVGIDPGNLDRIFEPFRQLEPSMTRRAGGTGLGLAVSRRFAALLGGTITVDSTPGQGSRFTVVLPLSGTP